MEHEGTRDGDALLKEGARSYLEAVIAVTTFRSEVQRRSRRVMDRQLADFGDALGGVSLNEIALKEWGDELRETWDGNEIGLGVKIPDPIPRMPRFSFSFYFGLYWSQWDEDAKGPWFGIYTGAHVQDKDRKRLLIERIRNICAGSLDETGDKATDVWICRRMEPETICSFEDTLGEMVAKWVRVGKESGGFRKLIYE